MINKDYILRIVEQTAKMVTTVLGLRQQNKPAEALAYLDNQLQQTVGLSSSFINTLTEETLLQVFSPMGNINTNSCLWAASLLKAEGSVYEDIGNTTQSYYRYRKSLYLLIAAILHEPIDRDSELFQSADELIDKLSAYEIPQALKQQIFAYYEHAGRYDKAENTLFELLETTPTAQQVVEQGQSFYARLQQKGAEDLQAGNFSLAEVAEGLEQLQAYPHA
jgi:tetratricopeptide (TPR) repeat protein